MITGVVASLLGAIYMRITLDTISARHKEQVAYGYGQKNEIAGIVSTHGNFAAYMPFALVLMLVLELMALHLDQPLEVLDNHLDLKVEVMLYVRIFLWIMGACLVAGRVFHYQGLSKYEKAGNFAMRKLGMHLTLWPVIALIVVVGIISVVSL